MSLTELTPDENKFFETGGNVSPPEVSTPEVVTPAPEVAVTPETNDKQVPLAALHEARQIQKELREELQRAREEARQAAEKATKYSSTFEKFLAEQTKQAAPKYEEDPLGALKYENDQLKEKIQQLDTGVQKNQEDFTRAQQYQSFAQHVQAQEATYKQTATDYDQAIAHLKQVRLQDFADLGLNQADAQAALQNEIFGLAQAAVQNGRNPAEIAYKMAQRYGYKSDTTNVSDKKLETLAKGQEASKTLAGGKADVPLTLDALSQLDDDQLDALIKDDKAWKKLGR